MAGRVLTAFVRIDCETDFKDNPEIDHFQTSPRRIKSLAYRCKYGVLVRLVFAREVGSVCGVSGLLPRAILPYNRSSDNNNNYYFFYYYHHNYR
jgi:hypothetical protein